MRWPCRPLYGTAPLLPLALNEHNSCTVPHTNNLMTCRCRHAPPTARVPAVVEEACAAGLVHERRVVAHARAWVDGTPIPLRSGAMLQSVPIQPLHGGFGATGGRARSCAAVTQAVTEGTMAAATPSHDNSKPITAHQRVVVRIGAARVQHAGSVLPVGEASAARLRRAGRRRGCIHHRNNEARRQQNRAQHPCSPQEPLHVRHVQHNSRRAQSKRALDHTGGYGPCRSFRGSCVLRQSISRLTMLKERFAASSRFATR